MRVLVLGPMALERGSLTVEIGGPRQRSVLAVLVLARGRVVSLDRLIDLVYEGEPPPSAVGSMQAYVSALRRVLEPDRPPRSQGQVLVSRAPGYAVLLPEEQVDAWRFETLVAQGRRAMTNGQWAEAGHRLREGLSLWRGDVLSDLPPSLLRPERTRLEEARVAAESDAARVELALGRVEEATARLTGLAASNPLREPLWELYALALYRAGRQAEALAVCARLRRTLRDELGVDPGSGITDLETAMLRQDPGLDGPVPLPGSAGTDPTEPKEDTQHAEPAREPFVGRGRAMSVLTAAAATASRGTTGVAVVAGPAGVGKSRLVAEFTASGRDHPLVVWGRATDSAHRSALRVWRQVVQALEDRLGIGASLRTTFDAADEVLDQDRAIVAMVERVDGLLRAMGSPVVVVLEDLHWVDDASLQVARVLLNEVTDVPALFIITVRDDESDQSPALASTMAELARCGARRVDLPPLTREEVHTYVARATGTDDPGTAARIFSRTSGHPFFVVELVRLFLSADGGHALDEDSQDVPSGVRDVVRARLARLPGPTRSVLAAAAVLGDHATLDLVETACGVDGNRLLDALEPALVTRLIEFSSTGQPLLFTHSLIRQAVSDEVTTLRRARILASAAARAGLSWAGDMSRAGALADLSLSAAEAGAFSVADAVAVTRTAAAPLHEAGSYGEAAALLQRAAALSIPGPWQARHETLLALAGSQLRAGDLKGWSATVEQSLETALEHRDWQAGGRSLLDVGAPWSYLSYGRVRTRPVELLTELVELTPADTPQGQHVKALASAALAAELYFSRDTQRCAELSASAVSLARRLEDAALFARVVALREMAVWDSDGAPARIALRREAIGLGLPRDDEAAAQYRNAMDLFQTLDAPAAEAALQRCEELISGRITPAWEVALGHLRASRLVATGRLTAGEDLARRTSDVQRRTSMGALDVAYGGLMLSIRLEQGRLGEVQGPLEDAVARSGLTVLRDGLAFVLAHTGQYTEARAVQASTLETPRLPDDGLLTGTLALRAFTLHDVARAGRDVSQDEAAAIHQRLSACAGELVMHGTGIGVWGAVDLFEGMTALLCDKQDVAIDALERAVTLNDLDGNVAWGARARRLLARTLLENRLAEGTGAIRQAQCLVAQADDALAAAGMPATAGSV